MNLNDLKTDLQQLSNKNINSKLVDPITQYFHFNDFFLPQINAWNKLSQNDRESFLAKIGLTKLASMTPNNFYNTVAKELHTPKFTTFNLEMMNQLLTKYNPKSLVDPCMGWGHRMLLSTACGIQYFGSDIRYESYANNLKMYNFAKDVIPLAPIKLQAISGDQILKHIQSTPDMLFTCPPYFDSEIYSNKGIENANYSEFLNFWYKISKQAYNKGIKTLAFQITPKYGTDLQKMSEKAGYNFKESITNTRTKSNKLHSDTQGNINIPEYGQIYILQKQ